MPDNIERSVDAPAAASPGAGVDTAVSTGLRAEISQETAQAVFDLRESRELLRVTLSSIGDAVISADVNGNITFLNPVAEALTGWAQADAVGLPLVQVFRIISESAREPVESPTVRALRDGVVVGLANHTLLIARDGTETPI